MIKDHMRQTVNVRSWEEAEDRIRPDSSSENYLLTGLSSDDPSGVVRSNRPVQALGARSRERRRHFLMIRA